MQLMFSEGTSQHSLLKNRIKAFYISKSLLMVDKTINYTSKELKEALPPVVSIIKKQQKHKVNMKYETDFRYLVADEIHYVIELKDHHRAIGIMHLTERTDRAVMCYEIGYDINPMLRRKGYGKEAVNAIVNYCFSVTNIDMLIACVYGWNIKSSNMLKKLGLMQEGKSAR